MLPENKSFSRRHKENKNKTDRLRKRQLRTAIHQNLGMIIKVKQAYTIPSARKEEEG